MTCQSGLHSCHSIRDALLYVVDSRCKLLKPLMHIRYCVVAGFLDLQKPLTRQVGSLWSCELCPCLVSELAIQVVDSTVQGI